MAAIVDTAYSILAATGTIASSVGIILMKQASSSLNAVLIATVIEEIQGG